WERSGGAHPRRRSPPTAGLHGVGTCSVLLASIREVHALATAMLFPRRARRGFFDQAVASEPHHVLCGLQQLTQCGEQVGSCIERGGPSAGQGRISWTPGRARGRLLIQVETIAQERERT